MAEMIIRPATLHDLMALQTFLRRMKLMTDGLLVPGTRCWLAELPKDRIIGTAAVEWDAQCGLLRSAAVDPAFRSQGIGRALVNCVLEACAATGRERVYCFSTGAGGYWQHLGFKQVSVIEVVKALPHAPQVLVFERLGLLPTEIAWRKDLRD